MVLTEKHRVSTLSPRPSVTVKMITLFQIEMTSERDCDMVVLIGPYRNP